MDDIVLTTQRDVRHWVDTGELSSRLQDVNDCTLERLQTALVDIGNAAVASVTVNRSGIFESPDGPISGLPDFLDVRVHIQSAGGRTAEVTLWAPVKWNQRFLGVGGGGNRTLPQWIPGLYSKPPTMADGVRNGFAVAYTDAGNNDPRFVAWGLDLETGGIDWDLTENWSHLSTHEMTVVCKALVRNIYGEGPRFSYLAGSSGGGRQTIEQAQRYPENYDGYWADCPAINWTKMQVAEIWPALVMKELNNPLPAAKSRAFQSAAIAAFDGTDGLEDGLISTAEFKTWDPQQIVGQETEAGPITELDAKVMAMIWEGPISRTGQKLWYGVPIGAESWGENLMGVGLMQTVKRDGVLTPVPFFISADWIGSWVLRDPDWDWTTLTFEKFDEVFERSVTEFESVDCSNPDFSGLRAAGGKLLLSHGMADEVIPPQGTVHYYDSIIETMGEEATKDIMRFFLTPGDVHPGIAGPGPGISLASGMTALMEWVEDGYAPDVILGSRMNPATFEVDMTRPLCAYPGLPRYVGGDPNSASSFDCQTR